MNTVLNAVRLGLGAGVLVAAAGPLAGCSSEVVASEAPQGTAVWNGYHAEVRLIVYDDLNPNLNKRKVALNEDLSQASESLKAVVRGLAPVAGPLSCAESGKVYVLEVMEAGGKRKYSSTNNACNAVVSYAGFVPTESLAHLAQAMGQPPVVSTAAMAR